MRVENESWPGWKTAAGLLSFLNEILNEPEAFKGINLKFIFTNRWSVYIMKLRNSEGW